MATWKIAPALAAGCTAVLKPSELASVYVTYQIFNSKTALSSATDSANVINKMYGFVSGLV